MHICEASVQCESASESSSEEQLPTDEDEESGAENLEGIGEYPDSQSFYNKTLEKASTSLRYGDPNDPSVRRHYEEGHQYPFPGALQEGTLMTLQKRETFHNATFKSKKISMR